MDNKFEIKKSVADKTIFITLNGKFDKEDGLGYINSYNDILKTIDSKEYILKFDCTNLAVSANESLDVLQDCFIKYNKFKQKFYN